MKKKIPLHLEISFAGMMGITSLDTRTCWFYEDGYIKLQEVYRSITV